MGDATGCTCLVETWVCRLAGGHVTIPGSARESLPDLTPDLPRGVVDCVHIYVCATVAQGIDQSREGHTGEWADEVALGNGPPGEHTLGGHATIDKSEEEGHHRAVFTCLSEMDVGLGYFVDVPDSQLVPDSVAGKVEYCKAVALAFNSRNFVLSA